MIGEIMKAASADTEPLRKRIAELEAALLELTEACEKEFCSPITESKDGDDESVLIGDSNIKFGMIRRARAVLST